MWLNNERVNTSTLCAYQASLASSVPRHVVIDNLFDAANLDAVQSVLQQPHRWKSQKHAYSQLYVDSAQWQKTRSEERFVQRDVWQRERVKDKTGHSNIAEEFLSFLRGDEFMSVLSNIFNVPLTDMNVADPEINTNYFRLGINDFVKEHVDDSPGRRVCMLLYLNKAWHNSAGGELIFAGKEGVPVTIAPLHNRCVLFDPSSEGSEHKVETFRSALAGEYRYNVTSWYWSE